MFSNFPTPVLEPTLQVKRVLTLQVSGPAMTNYEWQPSPSTWSVIYEGPRGRLYTGKFTEHWPEEMYLLSDLQSNLTQT